jgi:Tfp pilus assembly protein PilF
VIPKHISYREQMSELKSISEFLDIQQRPSISLLRFGLYCARTMVMVLATLFFQSAIAQNAPVSDSEARPLLEAFAAIDGKHYREAEIKLRSLSTSTNPYLATMAFEGLAHLYQKTREFSKSMAAYEAAISKRVASPGEINSFHKFAGLAAVMAGEYDAAVQHLEEWLAYPDSAQGRSNSYSMVLSYLAIAQAEKHQFEEASVTIDRAIASVQNPSHGLLVIQTAIKDTAAAPNKFISGSIAALVQSN